MLRRRYFEYDANFEFRRVVWIDLESAARTVVMADDLPRAGAIAEKILLGRDIEDAKQATEHDGVWPKGENPWRGAKRYPRRRHPGDLGAQR